MNDLTLSVPEGLPYVDIVREFDAPAALVFRAHSEADLVTEWLGPRGMTMRVDEWDARTGGVYRYLHTDQDGTEYPFRGVFHTVQAPESGTAGVIVQTFEWLGAPNTVALDHLTITDLGGRCRLDGHSIYPDLAARDAMVETGMEDGVRDSMDRLSELLARQEG